MKKVIAGIVQVIRQCVEGHEFTQEFKEPYDWGVINAAVATKEPRCPEHPPPVYYDYYDD